MGVAPTVAMGPLADGSISNFTCNISNYLCTNFGAFIKKCAFRPKMAAYPLYYNRFYGRPSRKPLREELRSDHVHELAVFLNSKEEIRIAGIKLSADH